MLYYLLHSLVSSMFVGKWGDRACLPYLFLDRSLGSHKGIVLASFSVSEAIFVGIWGECTCLSFLIGLISVLWSSRQIVPCWHTSRSWLPFFLIGLIFVLWRSCQIFTCWYTCRLFLPFFKYEVNIFSMAFSSDCSMLAHMVAGDEVSVTPIRKIAVVLFSCWT